MTTMYRRTPRSQPRIDWREWAAMAILAALVALAVAGICASGAL